MFHDYGLGHIYSGRQSHHTRLCLIHRLYSCLFEIAVVSTEYGFLIAEIDSEWQILPKVYHDEYHNESLDDIYYRFNIEIPEDYHGHSLSVSDVIVLHTTAGIAAYYVDSFGFKELPDFFDNYLKSAEEMLEDNYGMIDGIINNGSKAEKTSLLDKLQEKKELLSAVDQNNPFEQVYMERG